MQEAEEDKHLLLRPDHRPGFGGPERLGPAHGPRNEGARPCHRRGGRRRRRRMQEPRGAGHEEVPLGGRRGLLGPSSALGKPKTGLSSLLHFSPLPTAGTVGLRTTCPFLPHHLLPFFFFLLVAADQYTMLPDFGRGALHADGQPERPAGREAGASPRGVGGRVRARPAGGVGATAEA